MTALIAAVLTASAALVAALIAGIYLLRTERLRRKNEQAVAAQHELRSRTGTAFAEMFALQHEIEWLSWHATKDRTSVDGDVMQDYNSAVHTIYPRLLGAMAGVAALDLNLYEKLQPLATQLYDLDERVAVATLSLRRDRESVDWPALEEVLAAARGLYGSLPKDLAQAMRSAAPDS